jgi:hypothetical protein
VRARAPGWGSWRTDSARALAALGGGCFPIGIADQGLARLALVNPEWAPVVNGLTGPMSTPVVLHGTVPESKISTDDFPSTHVTQPLRAGRDSPSVCNIEPAFSRWPEPERRLLEREQG